MSCSNDDITEEDEQNLNIKQKVKAIDYIRKVIMHTDLKAKLNKEVSQDEGLGYRNLMDRFKNDLILLIESRNQTFSPPVTLKDVYDTKSWFWIDRIPSVSATDLINWKNSEKFNRSQEELEMVKQDIENLDCIKNGLEDFFLFYKNQTMQENMDEIENFLIDL